VAGTTSPSTSFRPTRSYTNTRDVTRSRVSRSTRSSGAPVMTATRLCRDAERRFSCTIAAGLVFAEEAPNLIDGMSRCLSRLGALRATLVWGPRGRDPCRRRPADRCVRRLLRRVARRVADPRGARSRAKGAFERSHRCIRTNFVPGRSFANELDYEPPLHRWCDKVKASCIARRARSSPSAWPMNVSGWGRCRVDAGPPTDASSRASRRNPTCGSTPRLLAGLAAWRATASWRAGYRPASPGEHPGRGGEAPGGRADRPVVALARTGARAGTHRFHGPRPGSRRDAQDPEPGRPAHRASRRASARGASRLMMRAPRPRVRKLNVQLMSTSRRFWKPTR
jgi:hypothetical protein